MSQLGFLIRRNTKIFFKDKGTFMTALIAPLVLLLLFITFLGNVYTNSFHSILPKGMEVSDKLTKGFVGGWLFSSLLAVCCVTVAFTANMTMVQDKVTGAKGDYTIAPVRRSTLAIGYYLSTALITGIICYFATCVGFVYLFAVGWYLSASDVLLVLLDVLLLVLFGTALSSLVCFFLKSQGGMTAVTTIVSAAYGFLCGAYMPIASFSENIQKIITVLPGTYATVLLHNHLMGGTLRELGKTMPQKFVDSIRDGFDNHLYFFDHKVELWQMYCVIGAAIVVLIGVYIVLNMLKKRDR